MPQSKGMPSVTLVIDGTERVIKIKPIGMMAAERRWGGGAFDDQPIEAMLYATWMTLGKPCMAVGVKVEDAFEEWVESVEDFILPEDAPAADEDPTTGDSPPDSTTSLPAPESPSTT